MSRGNDAATRCHEVLCLTRTRSLTALSTTHNTLFQPLLALAVDEEFHAVEHARPTDRNAPHDVPGGTYPSFAASYDCVPDFFSPSRYPYPSPRGLVPGELEPGSHFVENTVRTQPLVIHDCTCSSCRAVHARAAQANPTRLSLLAPSAGRPAKQPASTFVLSEPSQAKSP